MSFLAFKGVKTSLRASSNAQCLLRASGDVAGRAEVLLELSGAQIFFSLSFLSHPSPAVLFSAHNKEEKLKVPAEFSLSCPGEEEMTALEVEQSKLDT